MTLVSVSGTSLFRCVPERMMKRKTSFYCTVDGMQLLTVFLFLEVIVMTMHQSSLNQAIYEMIHLPEKRFDC